MRLRPLQPGCQADRAAYGERQIPSMAIRMACLWWSRTRDGHLCLARGVFGYMGIAPSACAFETALYFHRLAVPLGVRLRVRIGRILAVALHGTRT